MKRKFTPDSDGLTFSITCASCPLLPSLKTLGMEARKCTSGIFTNMQGAVPLSTCEHLETGSISENLMLICNKENLP